MNNFTCNDYSSFVEEYTDFDSNSSSSICSQDSDKNYYDSDDQPAVIDTLPTTSIKMLQAYNKKGYFFQVFVIV